MDTIEALITKIDLVGPQDLLVITRYLVADRDRLKLLLEDAQAINEEWRQGVDRLGAENAALRAELTKLKPNE